MSKIRYIAALLTLCSLPALAQPSGGTSSIRLQDSTNPANRAKVESNGSQDVVVTGATGVNQGSTSAGQTVAPIGQRTLSATPTDATAQTNMPSQDTNAATIIWPYGLADISTLGSTAAMTGTTPTVLLAAPGAGLHNVALEMSCVNSHATVGTFVDVTDGSGGTVLKVLAAAAVFGGQEVTFPGGLRQPTTNTALYVVDETTGANVKCSATGVKKP
jgi:hypothetical protein